MRNFLANKALPSVIILILTVGAGLVLLHGVINFVIWPTAQVAEVVSDAKQSDADMEFAEGFWVWMNAVQRRAACDATYAEHLYAAESAGMTDGEAKAVWFVLLKECE
jgi:hypothetical protein